MSVSDRLISGDELTVNVRQCGSRWTQVEKNRATPEKWLVIPTREVAVDDRRDLLRRPALAPWPFQEGQYWRVVFERDAHRGRGVAVRESTSLSGRHRQSDRRPSISSTKCSRMRPDGLNDSEAAEFVATIGISAFS